MNLISKNGVSNSMLRNHCDQRAFLGAAALMLIIIPAGAQNLGSLGGTVRDESALGVEAIVTIATQGFRQQATSLPDGTFEFLNIRPGIYLLCAQPTGLNAKPADDPFVDGCLWQDSFSVKAVLGPGQSLHAITVSVAHGAAVRVRVNDPGGKLPPALGAVAGNQLSVMIAGPSGLVQHVPITSQDPLGRDHSIVIPFDIPHKLLIHSSNFALADANSNRISDAFPTSVKVSHGVQNPPFIVNLVGPKQ